MTRETEEEEFLIERYEAEQLGCTAKLEIRRAAGMDAENRQAVAGWLRKQARRLLKDGDNYALLYTARFNPDPPG